MPYQPTVNFKLSDGRDLGSLGWITKEYLMTVYPQIAANMITPELWVWGDNYSGKLGDNTTEINRSTPVTTLAGGANWKSVSGGSNHTVAIKTDGTLWTWGDNYSGKLGDNTAGIAKSTPVTTFAGGTNWKQVAGGYGHTAAIKTDGTLWTWGGNYRGRLGNNINGYSEAMTPITTFAGGTNWKQVSCGGYYTSAIKTDGTLWVWGYNSEGQLGDNTTTDRCTPVTTFAGGTNWKQVACTMGSYGYTAAIKTDGTLWTWGRNGSGQLGNNTISIYSLTPVTTFAGGTNWKQVACGSEMNDGHIAAIKTDGTLWTWGTNSSGQLGDNTSLIRCTPVTTFAGGTNWKQVDCGNDYTAAIKTDGTLWVWGRNNSGELGINNTTTRCTPVTTFAGGTNWKQVAAVGGGGAGNNFTVAIRTSDDLLGI